MSSTWSSNRSGVSTNSRYSQGTTANMIAGRIRCSVGGEWRDRSHFSAAQIARLETTMRRDKAITVANSAIICLEHTNRTALEIRCEGCRRILPIDRFSRNTRRKGKNLCEDCVQWAVQTENGDYMPPPGAKMTWEERSYHKSLMEADAEAGDLEDDDDDDDQDDLRDLKLDPKYAKPAWVHDGMPNPNATVVKTESSDMTSVLGSDMASVLGSNVSVAKMRPIKDDDDAASTVPSLSTISGVATTLFDMSNSDRVSYNAWGPDGELTRRVKEPTETGSVFSIPTVSSTTNTDTKEVTMSRSGWAKVNGRKQLPKVPDYLRVKQTTELDDFADAEWEGEASGDEM